MSRVLKAQLFELEKNAATLERIVLNELNALDSLPVHQLEPAESKVFRKLHKLDDIQDEIDAIVAKLKEAGAWETHSYADAKYRYVRPKYVKPLPQKEAKAKARAEYQKAKAKQKVYPAQSPRDPKPKKRRTDRELSEARQARQAAREAREAAKALREAAKVDAALQLKKTGLEHRLIERKAKVAEVANLTKKEGGSQKRNNARKNLLNVERQLEELNALIANRSQ